MFQKFEWQSRHTDAEGFGQILVHDCDDGWMETGDDERRLGKFRCRTSSSNGSKSGRSMRSCGLDSKVMLLRA